MERPSRESLSALIRNNPEAIYDLISHLFDIITSQQKTINELTLRVKELESRLNQNSHNSSKPPSTDGFNKPNPKSLRIKSKKKRGGQPGHKGHHLEMTETPDEIQELKNENCEYCGEEFAKKSYIGCDKRQIFDVVFKVKVCEYRSHKNKCSCGKTTHAPFPKNVRAKTQYGEKFNSLLVYLNQYQLIPYKRLAEMVEVLTGLKISEGTVFNAIKRVYQGLECFESGVKEKLINEPVVGFDETSIRTSEGNSWIHTVSTDKITLLSFHKNRGNKAMDEIGILPAFNGIAVHDYWKSYYVYQCLHALCGAHLLRELVFLYEEQSVRWAKKVMLFLLEIYTAVVEAKGQNQVSLEIQKIKEFMDRYDLLVINAFRSTPKQRIRTGSRGRIKQSKARNLAVRLKERKNDILRFANDFRVPFDNNSSERTLRMSKVKQKISGCFRSDFGAIMFCRIRSYIETLNKNGKQILVNISGALEGNAFIPDSG